MRWQGWMVRFKKLGKDEKLEYKLCETEADASALVTHFKAKGLFAEYWEL